MKKTSSSQGSRAREDVLQGVVVAGIASLPTEACLRMSLEDNRVFKRWRDWQIQAKEQCDFVDGISDFTWECLGNLCGWSAAEVRNHSLGGDAYQHLFLRLECIFAHEGT